MDTKLKCVFELPAEEIGSTVPDATREVEAKNSGDSVCCNLLLLNFSFYFLRHSI